MTLFDLLILLLVAGICGALGQAITGFSRGGCLVSIALGFVGAVIGMWLARTLGLPDRVVHNWLRVVCGDYRVTHQTLLLGHLTSQGSVY
jgi:uncharacterized membrane protein YeaQ/YmgE (transglycosylase-associated protein family)